MNFSRLFSSRVTQLSTLKLSRSALFEKSSWLLPGSILAGFVTFLLLHDLSVIRRELNHRKRAHLYGQYLLTSNERPFEYIGKLFGVCIESQSSGVMSESHLKAQHFLSESAILRRTKHFSSYFREVPTEGLRRVQEAEKAFPLAFVHLVHNDVGIFEMFLAVMFRPQNYHCVHVDSKASSKVKKAVSGIVRSYQQMFNSTKIFMVEAEIVVYWAHITVIEAELMCFDALLKYPDWKYIINTAGSELPNYSHRRLRAELEAADGKDILVSVPFPDHHWERFNETHNMIKFGPGKYDYKIDLKGSGILKEPPPYGIRMYKGYKNVALTRATAAFVSGHPIAAAFRSWLADTLIPDESYYATMARVRAIDLETQHVVMDNATDTLHGSCTRISLWKNKEDNSCAGSIIRDVCNFGFGDLFDVWKSDCWMANKFNTQVDANAVICHVKHIMEVDQG